jgi:hypothetical protein
MGWAIAEANQAKVDGARIIGIGEGGDLSVNNMIGISGTSVRTPAPASTSVDVWTTDFASLASTLATFAGETCPAFVNVHKTIDTDGNLGTTGDQAPGASWTFNCSAGPDICTPSSGNTDGSGNITFEVDPGGDNSASVNIVEPGEVGFGFLSASCTKNALPIGTPGAGQVTAIGPLARQDVVNCTFYNTPAAYLTQTGLRAASRSGAVQPASTARRTVRTSRAAATGLSSSRRERTLCRRPRELGRTSRTTIQ